MIRPNRLRLLLSPLWFLVALVGLIASVTVSGNAAHGTETRVRAIPTAEAITVGSVASEGSASVGRLRQVSTAIASATGVATNTDLHAFGGATGPRSPRAGVDFEVGADGLVIPQAAPLPRGASTFGDPAQSGLSGVHHSIPAGTPMPPGFGVVADGIDVVPGSIHAATHHTIFPTRAMTPEAFSEGFLNLPWSRAGRIR